MSKLLSENALEFARGFPFYNLQRELSEERVLSNIKFPPTVVLLGVCGLDRIDDRRAVSSRRDEERFGPSPRLADGLRNFTGQIRMVASPVTNQARMASLA
jgi:hypothetical protein